MLLHRMMLDLPIVFGSDRTPLTKVLLSGIPAFAACAVEADLELCHALADARSPCQLRATKSKHNRSIQLAPPRCKARNGTPGCTIAQTSPSAR